MTFYKAVYTGSQHKHFKHGEVYEIVLAELPKSIEMKLNHKLHIKTQHASIESMLNTWGFIVPIKINNRKLTQ